MPLKKKFALSVLFVAALPALYFSLVWIGTDFFYFRKFKILNSSDDSVLVELHIGDRALFSEEIPKGGKASLIKKLPGSGLYRIYLQEKSGAKAFKGFYDSGSAGKTILSNTVYISITPSKEVTIFSEDK